MPTSYVLVNSELGAEERIISEIRSALESEPAELEIQGVYGVYDIVVRISSDSAELLREAVTSKIRRIRGVRATLTMMVVEGQG